MIRLDWYMLNIRVCGATVNAAIVWDPESWSGRRLERHFNWNLSMSMPSERVRERAPITKKTTCAKTKGKPVLSFLQWHRLYKEDQGVEKGLERAVRVRLTIFFVNFANLKFSFTYICKIYICVCVVFVYVYAPCTCLIACESQTGLCISWYWSYRWLGATM